MRPIGLRAWSPVSAGDAAMVGVPSAIAAAAWVTAIVRMAGMAAGLWSYPADFGHYLATWVAMMAAMMLPSITPTALVRDRSVRSHRGPRTALATSAAFVGAYLVVWAAAGLVPYALLRAGGAVAGGLLVGGAGRYLAAGVLAVAAAYQLAPPKRACLSRTCDPPPLAGEVGHGGWSGALRAGVTSGGWCLGCCWALMASLFALGAMSLTWMVVIWALVMAERFLPSRRLAALGVAAVLAALALGVVAGAPVSAIPGTGGASM